MLKLNENEITPTIFPDGTSQVWKLGFNYKELKNYHIKWDFEEESELFHLAQLVKLLRHGTIPRQITLTIPYLPYGRQDKHISDESTFALRVFSDLINNLNFDKVFTVDAHSDEAEKLINNLVNYSTKDRINEVLALTLADTIAYPDTGAFNRYSPFHLKSPINKVIGHKKRDQLTGYITEYNYEGDVNGKSVLIVDDICDGGMTFILLTKSLLDGGAKSVDLYTSHGIYSKGVEVLRDSGIGRIFTKEGEV